MNKICGIYKITSPSGKIYIGQSTNINQRIGYYKRLNCKNQTKLYNSILKYGWNDHTFEITHICNEHELNELEKFYIKIYKSFNTIYGLNLTEGGHNGKLSDETKIKIGEKNKGNKYCLGRVCSDETKLKIGNGNRNKKHSKEHILKFILSRKGIQAWNKGLKMPENFKRNISNGLKRNNGSGNYEIYNQRNELVYRFKSNFATELKKSNLPYSTFFKSHRNNTIISYGIYTGWRAIKS